MDSPPMTTSPRHRLMCSYGGKIMPRPQTKSLYYSGGENRMVTIPAAVISTLTLSSLTAHLSAFLNLASPFVLKYQLPHQDLDSLISISTDDDLQIMLEENIRLSSASTPSRIRLFLFPVVESVKTELTHPKRESWFDDALRSARVGFGGEINGEQESIALETSSSFGSTSSSHSLSNLPPIKASPDSIPSDDYVGSAVSTVQIGICQELVDPIAAMENLVSPNSFDSENTVADASSGIEPHKTIQASGFQANIMGSAHKQAPYVPEGSYYIPQNMPGSQQVSPYYNVYHPLPHQQPLHYQPNQPPLNYQPNQQYPLYYLPIVQTPPIVSTPPVVPAPPIVPTPPVVPAQPVVPTQPVVSTQSYNMPVQYGMVQASSIGSGQPQTHLNATLLPPQQVIKEVAVSPQPLTELTTPAYKNIPGGNLLIHVPYTETETRLLGVQIQHQPQAFGVVAGETANYTNKLDDDPARFQLYKSQPPPPMLS